METQKRQLSYWVHHLSWKLYCKLTQHLFVFPLRWGNWSEDSPGILTYYVNVTIRYFKAQCAVPSEKLCAVYCIICFNQMWRDKTLQQTCFFKGISHFIVIDTSRAELSFLIIFLLITSKFGLDIVVLSFWCY